MKTNLIITSAVSSRINTRRLESLRTLALGEPASIIIGYLFSDGYRLFRFGDYDKFEEDPYGYNTPFGIKGEKLKYAYLVKEDVK